MTILGADIDMSYLSDMDTWKFVAAVAVPVIGLCTYLIARDARKQAFRLELFKKQLEVYPHLLLAVHEFVESALEEMDYRLGAGNEETVNNASDSRRKKKNELYTLVQKYNVFLPQHQLTAVDELLAEVWAIQHEVMALENRERVAKRQALMKEQHDRLTSLLSRIVLAARKGTKPDKLTKETSAIVSGLLGRLLGTRGPQT